MFPQLSMLGINQKLREHWHSLTQEEKNTYKERETTVSTSSDINCIELKNIQPMISFFVSDPGWIMEFHIFENNSTITRRRYLTAT